MKEYSGLLIAIAGIGLMVVSFMYGAVLLAIAGVGLEIYGLDINVKNE